MYPATFLGNIGNVKETQIDKDRNVINFGLATRSTKDESGQRNTIWVNISIFGETADLYKPIIKTGNQVLCEGFLIKPFIWDNSEDKSVNADYKMVCYKVSLAKTELTFVTPEDSVPAIS